MAQFETGNSIRQLVKTADDLSDDEKASKIDEIENQINDLKDEQKLSNVEHLMLQLALLKLSSDPEQAKQQSEEIIAQYRQLAAERNQEFISNPSPQFKAYKSREKRLSQRL